MVNNLIRNIKKWIKQKEDKRRLPTFLFLIKGSIHGTIAGNLLFLREINWKEYKNNAKTVPIVCLRFWEE